MARRVFYSFHYSEDNWRASQVRNMGVIEGNSPCSDNDWETVTKGKDSAIQNWINDQLKNRSCTIVLIGEKTQGRKWIKYEIEKSWNDGKGLLGIYIHNLKNAAGEQSSQGKNPFADFSINGTNLDKIVKSYSPPYKTSINVYDDIKKNLADWVEEAIEIRGKY